MAFIEVNNISRSFQDKTVLKDVSMTIEKGSVIGLLGPSGAGKTTLIHILTGQLKPDGGNIVQETELVSGIMMDCFGLYERLSVWDNLKIFARLYHVSDKKIKELLVRTQMQDAKKTAVSNLSKGMKSRVNFCRALLKEADILYLDEPTSGLDPVTTDNIHALIMEEKEKGTTIFLTTHNMYEAEKLCDKIVLLNEGTIVEQGAPEEIRRKYNTENKMEIVLKSGEKHEVVNKSENAVMIFEWLKEEKIASIHSAEPTLETVFLHLTGRKLSGL